jgi:beta-glucosidase
LFERLAATGKPIVTVVFSGRPLALSTVVEKSSAVLLAWQPGVQAGAALGDVLVGRVAPTGHLTVTIPRSVGQVPVYYNHLATGRPFEDYRDASREPLFPFGFGLTYTAFSFGPTRVDSPTTIGEKVTVRATVTNTGDVRGTAIPQLYLHARACSYAARPVRELKGYERVTLDPGESREVTFTLATSSLGYFTGDGVWKTEPGKYEAVIASDAADGRLVEFTVGG